MEEEEVRETLSSLNRAVGRSENPWGDMDPLNGIKLTDVPKFGKGGGRPHIPPLLPTALLQKLDNVTTKVWYVPDSRTKRQGRRGSSKTYRAVDLRQDLLNVFVLQRIIALI